MGTEKLQAEVGPVLVVLAPESQARALIEKGAVLARAQLRKLLCLSVDSDSLYSAEKEEALATLHDYARAQGADVSRIAEIDEEEAVLRFAAQSGAGTIVLGAGAGKRRTLAKRLSESERGFELLVLDLPRTAETKAAKPRQSQKRLAWKGSMLHYAAALGIVAAATILAWFLASVTVYWSPAILYLAIISLLALWLEPGPVLFAALASAVAWDFFFIPPRFTLNISRTEDILMLALYVLVSLCAGLATSRLHASQRILEEEKFALARSRDLATRLAGAAGSREVLALGLAALRASLECKTLVILRDDAGALKAEPEAGWEALNSDARRAAEEAFRTGSAAGRFSKTESGSSWRFEALASPDGRLGVVGLRPADGTDWHRELEEEVQAIVLTTALALARTGKSS